MKFSNFVSTLAVVCLTLNADALRVQYNPDDYSNAHSLGKDKLEEMFINCEQSYPKGYLLLTYDIC